MTTLRNATAQDETFLRQLAERAVTEELMAESWPAALRDSLVGMQAASRLAAARAHFPQGLSRIVTVDGADAGWLFTANLPDELRLVEILLLPERRGQGIGTALLRQIAGEAGRKPVRLYVNVMNVRASRLYERAGFVRIGGDEVQHLMEYRTT